MAAVSVEPAASGAPPHGENPKRCWCHTCGVERLAYLGDEDLHCQHCHGTFVEEVRTAIEREDLMSFISVDAEEAPEDEEQGAEDAGAGPAPTTAAEAGSSTLSTAVQQILSQVLTAPADPTDVDTLTPMVALLQTLSTTDDGAPMELYIGSPSRGPTTFAAGTHSHGGSTGSTAALFAALAQLGGSAGGGRAGPSGALGGDLGDYAVGDISRIIDQLMLSDPGLRSRGASKQFVAQLPRATRSDADGPEECAICQDRCTSGEECIRLPCGPKHNYHAQCILPWLEEHSTCPICRHQFPTEDDQCSLQDPSPATSAAEHR